MLDRVTKRTDLKSEIVTIVRLLMKQSPPIYGDLPAPDPLTLENPILPTAEEGAEAAK